MTNSNRAELSHYSRVLVTATLTAAATLISGCGLGSAGNSNSSAHAVGSSAIKLQGSVHGGQQAVSASTIQLYAANLTGYGLIATPLITATVTTDSNGNFTILNDYTCPSAGTPVYIVAKGGNAGQGSNTHIALMAALGPCGNLGPSTIVSINELTTVASAYALAGFMSTIMQLSASATNTTGLNLAFASVNKLVNTSTGTAPGPNLPATAVFPLAELNTIADIIAACINDSTQCTTLFTDTTPSSGTAPTNTIVAALNIATNPGSNTAGLFGLINAQSPFQPTLTSAPTDFTIAVKYPTAAGSFSTPSAAALDATGNLWVTNPGNNTITVLNATTAQPTIYNGGSLSAPSSIAFDAAGNAWVTDKGTSKLSVFTPAGVGTLTTATGLNSPTGVAIDGAGLVWVTNSGNSTVTQNTVSGTTVVSSSSSSSGSINAPTALAINPK